jgi:hypothetical protein
MTTAEAEKLYFAIETKVSILVVLCAFLEEEIILGHV